MRLNIEIKRICTIKSVLKEAFLLSALLLFGFSAILAQQEAEVKEITWEAGVQYPERIATQIIAEFPISYQWSGVEVLDAEFTWVADELPDEAEVSREVRPRWLVVEGVHSNSFLAQIRLPQYRMREGGVERLQSFSAVIASSPATHQRIERDWPENSVLAQGTWLRFATAEDGIFEITYNDLIEAGVNPDTLSFSEFQLYGSGGRQLPFENAEERPLDLPLIPVKTVGEGDGVFNSTDAILFYSSGVDTWSYSESSERWEHNKHCWSDSAFYFLQIDGPSNLEGSRIVIEPQIQGAADEVLTTHWARKFHEIESVNIAKSGREFYGEEFSYLGSQVFGLYFNMPNLTGETGYVDARIAGRTIGTTSDYKLSCNSVEDETSDLALTESSLLIAQKRTLEVGVPMGGDGVSVEMSFTPGNNEAKGWIDYVRVQAEQSLVFEGGQFKVHGSENVDGASISEYVMSGAETLEEVWDVTDPLLPFIVSHQVPQQGQVSWKAMSDTTRTFYTYRQTAAKNVAKSRKVSNSNLHALENIDLVILTTSFLDSAATRLAEVHANDGLRVAVVYQADVFNEFSSGSPDPTALKMLLLMLRDKAETEDDEPQFLQLMGDGTYFNRNLEPDGVNLLTFQSQNSESTVSSYVTDDYFGILGDEYGESAGDKLAVGVGRIPATSLSEALGFVSKVETYMGVSTDSTATVSCHDDGVSDTFGAWRNRILFVTDDQDGNHNDGWRHMSDSEVHSSYVYSTHDEYDVYKIYPDAFVQEATPGGERYDEAEAEITRKIEEGALIVDYIGHGGRNGWAHERILNTTTIREWTNKNRLPVFMTATCELSRYDDPNVESAGEMIVFNPNGGAISMLTTTRTVFSGGNQELNTAFFQTVLDEDAGTGEMRCLGDICKDTKNSPIVTSVTNMRNFSLLGDPAVRLAYPTESIYITELPDTIRSLDHVVVSGYVGDSEGNVLEDFNGLIYPKVFDKRSQLSTLDNDEVAGAFSYSMFRNVIHQGLASVTDGYFSFEFVVPRDIDYAFGEGRISLYALSGEVDAHGHTEDFVIGGISDDVIPDDEGPIVELYMNDSLFEYGGITSEDPWLYARVFDESGINTVGNGIGHDLKAVLDGAYDSPFILNDYFSADLDTYKSGTVLFPFKDLEEGRHELEIKVWDVQNNSALAYTEFIVVNSLEVALDQIIAYPNPASQSSTFRFSHNQECRGVKAIVEIYKSDGRKVRTFEGDIVCDGSRTDLIEWDLSNDAGGLVESGLYLFNIQIITETGASAQYGSKVVVVKP